MRRLVVGLAVLIGTWTAVVAPSSPAGATAARPSAAGTASGRVFRGNGGKTLPPFTVSGPSTLFWANNGGVFQIFPAGAASHGSVNSQARKGWTYLPAGRYLLQVNAIGDWVIQVVSGIIFPQRLGKGWVGYRGNGGLELPPFRAPRSEQLYWQASGDILQIFSSDFTGVEVNSQAHKGSTYMRRGMQHLQVNAMGAWVIAWRP